MNETKIFGVENINSKEETLGQLFTREGISPKKQAGSGDSNHLPADGEFIGFTFAGEGTMRHVVMLSEPAGHCSLSNLQAQAVFDTKKEDVKFEPSKRADLNGALFPVGAKKLNPQIPSSQILAVQMLVGKKFKASVREGIIQDYKADEKTAKPIWETDQKKAAERLVPKFFWKVDLT